MGPEQVATTLRELVAAYASALPEGDAESMSSLVAAGELSLAFETLCTQLYEYDVAVRPADHESLARIGGAMGVAPRFWTVLPVARPAAGRYLFVWDRDRKTVVASAFVPFAAGGGGAPLPTDTTHGAVRREDEDAFLARLAREFPGDRYVWGGGSGPSLARVVEGFFALEHDTDDR